MALTRKKLKKSQFGLPGQRKYPMPDAKHAANAKGRAKQQLKKGRLSRSAYEKIVAKANRVLGRTKKKTKKAKKSKK
jgi:hypothetical protein